MATPEPMVPAEDDPIDAIARAVHAGQCILFLGAGAHFPPPEGSSYSYPEAERPPMGSRLSEELAKKCDLKRHLPKESPSNLQRVALCFERRHSRARLIDELEAAVYTGKKPSAALRMLARLDFPMVITTNYDRLFEQALRAEGKDPQIQVYSPVGHEVVAKPRSDLDPQRPYFLKLHGDVLQRDSVVITDEDYIHFVMRMSDLEPNNPVNQGVKFFLTDLTTLFIGYSLLDYNLRLLFKTLRWKADLANIPASFSVDPFPDPLIVDVWYHERRHVFFVDQGVWEFVPRLVQRVEELKAAR